MKTGRASRTRKHSATLPRKSLEGIVHPVVIYPFRQPRDYSGVEELYKLVARLDAERERYARPITVLDRKTSHALARDRKFAAFRERTIARCSDILDTWAVDTCQMWYAGLGKAFEEGSPDDVYWLI